MGLVLVLLAGAQMISRSNSPQPPVRVASAPTAAPGVAATIVAPAEPRAPLQNYVTPFDRPASVSPSELNKVTVRLAIGPYGRLTDCLVIQSSGSAALDAATCSTLSRRARFIPARDANGNPVADVIEQQIDWQPE
jgi:protein TonB